MLSQSLFAQTSYMYREKMLMLIFSLDIFICLCLDQACFWGFFVVVFFTASATFHANLECFIYTSSLFFRQYTRKMPGQCLIKNTCFLIYCVCYKLSIRQEIGFVNSNLRQHPVHRKNTNDINASAK